RWRWSVRRWRRVVGLIDYAGAEIELDFLKHYGLDLHDFVRGRYPWGKFLRLVDALPTNSYYKDRLLSDPDIAADLLAAERAS
ncbi:hypothetical protein, partial [Staphylococcus arlettae]|uniref:hypothetical protein n=1 Tax=Staphylococcus arlettae TaxID=29378 RepID=UPI0028AA91B6